MRRAKNEGRSKGGREGGRDVPRRKGRRRVCLYGEKEARVMR